VSRIGKKIIELPQGVDVKIENLEVSVKGPKGVLNMTLIEGFSFQVEGNKLVVLNSVGSQEAAKFGLYRSYIANMVKGVSVGFSKDLEINGVGYKVQLQGTELVFALGFSHPVKVAPPEGITFTVEGQTKIKIEGIDKQKVGQVAANIRSIRKPDAYKGKGIKYSTEVIKKKQGKSAKK